MDTFTPSIAWRTRGIRLVMARMEVPRTRTTRLPYIGRRKSDILKSLWYFLTMVRIRTPRTRAGRQLHFASRGGHVKIARVLLELLGHGTDAVTFESRVYVGLISAYIFLDSAP